MTMIFMILKDISKRIAVFDCEGLPENHYVDLKEYLRETIGEDATNCFSKYIDATDGMFYFKTTAVMQECLNKILDIAIGTIEAVKEERF